MIRIGFFGGPSGLPFKIGFYNSGALMIRIGFPGPLYCTCNKEPQNSLGLGIQGFWGL